MFKLIQLKIKKKKKHINSTSLPSKSKKSIIVSLKAFPRNVLFRRIMRLKPSGTFAILFLVLTADYSRINGGIAAKCIFTRQVNCECIWNCQIVIWTVFLLEWVKKPSTNISEISSESLFKTSFEFLCITHLIILETTFHIRFVWCLIYVQTYCMIIIQKSVQVAYR